MINWHSNAIKISHLFNICEVVDLSSENNRAYIFSHSWQISNINLHIQTNLQSIPFSTLLFSFHTKWCKCSYFRPMYCARVRSVCKHCVTPGKSESGFIHCDVSTPANQDDNWSGNYINSAVFTLPYTLSACTNNGTMQLCYFWTCVSLWGSTTLEINQAYDQWRALYFRALLLTLSTHCL